jgi:uncharacterized membrane protein
MAQPITAGCCVVNADARGRSGHRDRESTSLPAEYRRLFHLWFAFGFPAFAAVLRLMIAKAPLG